ncbi:MAG: hypothetical protein K5978_07235, partial [Campylobacter sp.]|nr:hypothetical protein [Campylobacter sp.]
QNLKAFSHQISKQFLKTISFQNLKAFSHQISKQNSINLHEFTKIFKQNFKNLCKFSKILSKIPKNYKNIKVLHA